MGRDAPTQRGGRVLPALRARLEEAAVYNAFGQRSGRRGGRWPQTPRPPQTGGAARCDRGRVRSRALLRGPELRSASLSGRDARRLGGGAPYGHRRLRALRARVRRCGGRQEPAACEEQLLPVLCEPVRTGLAAGEHCASGVRRRPVLSPQPLAGLRPALWSSVRPANARHRPLPADRHTVLGRPSRRSHELFLASRRHSIVWLLAGRHRRRRAALS